MTTPNVMTDRTAVTDRAGNTRPAARRGHFRGDETKPSWKTTELFIYLLGVIGVLIASNAVGDSGGSRGDVFTADKAWWFITLMTVGYLVSRGLAKAGSRTRDEDPRTD